jgi:DNA-directed RNA polymerase specialized sigma24 family protein
VDAIMLQQMSREPNRIAQAVARYGRGLFGFIRARVPTDADAEDLLQDVWAQFSGQPEVEAIEQVSGWLYRVARNKIIDRYRKGRTEALEDLAVEDEDGEWSMAELFLAVEDDPDLRMLRELFWAELESAPGRTARETAPRVRAERIGGQDPARDRRRTGREHQDHHLPQTLRGATPARTAGDHLPRTDPALTGS